jgi:hypothetical protein
MASLNPAVALKAPADGDIELIELPVNGLARDIDRELLGDVGLDHGATTPAAGVG